MKTFYSLIIISIRMPELNFQFTESYKINLQSHQIVTLFNQINLFFNKIYIMLVDNCYKFYEVNSRRPIKVI